MTKFLVHGLRAASALALVGAASPSLAGGFLINEQSTTATGRALSGAAVAADGPGAIFFNPAIMTELEGIQLEAGGQILLANAEQIDRGSTRTIPGLPVTAPVGGNGGGNPFPQPLLVPNASASVQVSDRVWLGVSVNGPFGLISDYDEGFFGRYDADRSKLFTLNVQPSAAVKLSDNISIGAGLDVQYADVELTNALPNLVPGSPDGLLDVQGDDISFGWNAGATVTFDPVRFGFHYRSQVKHDLEGTLEISGLAGPLAANNRTDDASAPLDLPDIGTVSMQIGIETPYRFYATWRHYGWSSFEEVRVQPATGAALVDEQDYRDTWSMALGADYDVSDKLTVRAGTMFDQTPVTDEHRGFRIPDGDRTWLSAGLSYDLGHFTANLSYAHVWVASADVDVCRTVYACSPAAIDVRRLASSNGSVDILAASITSRF